MATLITNFTWHMKNETVTTLHNDQIITISDTSILTRTVPQSMMSHSDIYYEGKKLTGMQFGQLTVTEFIYATSALLN